MSLNESQLSKFFAIEKGHTQTCSSIISLFNPHTINSRALFYPIYLGIFIFQVTISSVILVQAEPKADPQFPLFYQPPISRVYSYPYLVQPSTVQYVKPLTSAPVPNPFLPFNSVRSYSTSNVVTYNGEFWLKCTYLVWVHLKIAFHVCLHAC